MTSKVSAFSEQVSFPLFSEESIKKYLSSARLFQVSWKWSENTALLEFT